MTTQVKINRYQLNLKKNWWHNCYTCNTKKNLELGSKIKNNSFIHIFN